MAKDLGNNAVELTQAMNRLEACKRRSFGQLQAMIPKHRNQLIADFEMMCRISEGFAEQYKMIANLRAAHNRVHGGAR
jgi:hypothetical protein